MREILFRAKSVNDLKWVEGFYVREAGHFIKELPSSVTTPIHLVYSETVGQFTGLTDKDGKKIFEGDIVRNADGYLFSAQYPFAVKFCDGNFCGDAGGFVYISGEEFRYCEVIGNINDNPELLEVDE